MPAAKKMRRNDQAAAQLLFRLLMADLAQPRSSAVAGATLRGRRTVRLIVLEMGAAGSCRSLVMLDFMQQNRLHAVVVQ